MKRYLLLGIALLFVNANGSLKEDFLQMDLAEEQLLSDIRKSVTLSGDTDEEIKDGITASERIEESALGRKEEILAPSLESTVNMSDSAGTVTSELDREVNESDSEEREDIIRQEAMDEADEAEKASVEKVAALKTEITAKEAAEQQRVAEKLEVEAYEKQRAEQLAQKTFDEAEIKEKSIEEIATEEVVISVWDVNISRELEEKTLAANEAYKNAVKEMQEED